MELNSNMIYFNIFNLTLITLLLNLSPQLYGQTNQSGIIKGSITDNITGNVLPGASIIIDLSAEEQIYAVSNIDGFFELVVPIGKHLLQASYLGYEDYATEIIVQAGDTLVYEILMTSNFKVCPWESSEPYAELSGTWKPVYYKKGKRKIDQTNKKWDSELSFIFPTDFLPGQLSWHDGCNANWGLCFRHTDKGIIEVQEKGLVGTTLMYCDKTDVVLGSFIFKMRGAKTKAVITNNGQLLELSLANEKYVLEKIHDNSRPDFNTDLFGTWKPVEGKLKRKMVEKFTDDAEVVFDTDKINGAIKYKDGEGCDNDHDNLYFNYHYSDSNFISISSRSWPTNDFHLRYRPIVDKLCQSEKLLQQLFKNFSKYGGCHLHFNETKNEVTLKYDEDFLILRRKQ